jgi:hypothetical protein
MARTILIPLYRIPAKLPKRRNGKRIHVSTVYRWTTRGLDGVVLDSVQVGSLRCCTPEMLDAFFAAVAAKRHLSPGVSIHPLDSPSIAKAKRALDAAGINIEGSASKGGETATRKPQ